jgi:Family of unknown function (DUF6912)
MCDVRVYLPATLAGLSARLGLAGAGARIEPATRVADGGDIAFGVTAALREWYREGDLEELEYVALTHAARASLRLLAGGRPAGNALRRVVLAAEVPGGAVVPTPDVDVAAMRLSEPVPFSAVAALHADEPSAGDEVAAAAAVIEAAIGGDADAAFVVDGLDDHELQWYAVQEIAHLLE